MHSLEETCLQLCGVFGLNNSSLSVRSFYIGVFLFNLPRKVNLNRKFVYFQLFHQRKQRLGLKKLIKFWFPFFSRTFAQITQIFFSFRWACRYFHTFKLMTDFHCFRISMAWYFNVPQLAGEIWGDWSWSDDEMVQPWFQFILLLSSFGVLFGGRIKG